MAWILLLAAIGFEVAGTVCMKLSDGFRNPLSSVLIFVFYGAAFGFLTLALKRMELSLAYAVWSGIGTAATVVIGVLWFQEALTVLKLASVALVIAGIVGLNLGGAH
ncbi:DMT family transporter [Inquilinus limosus]|uniref:Membrane protein n=1 Tax=Inquilinus limosus MP06 TaxID=1398085 RepID=A0A0A0D139_9PROT|nr:multidrug efflux SMR transporter [Inquilinus limosus]KGM31598.1 membrane protein [Inquilinus limosus MP06]